jgi:hypothetical protein
MSEQTTETDMDDVDLRKLSAIELIVLLDRSFPVRSIILGETVESAHRYAGRRDLVDELIAMKLEDEARDDE